MNVNSKLAAALACCLMLGAVALAADTTPLPATKAPASAASGMGMDCCINAAKAGLVCGSCNPDAKAEINKAAIDFTLKGVDGKDHNLSDFAGKTVVLIWSNPDCPIYSRVAAEGTISTLMSKYQGQPVQFIQIDSTASHTIDAVKAGDAKFAFTGLQLTDFDGKVGHVYDAKTTPHCFVIDNKGKLAYDGAIDNDPAGSMKVAERTNYVDAALQSVLKGQPVKVATDKPYGCSVKYAASAPAKMPVVKVDKKVTASSPK